MAYINQETKVKLVPAIKAVLKKYGVKGSIAIRDHAALVVTLTEGPVSFETANCSNWRAHDVNHYWVHNNYTGEAVNLIVELVNAMKGNEWYDHSDAQFDHFDTAYYIRIRVGRWDKPYVHTA